MAPLALVALIVVEDDRTRVKDRYIVSAPITGRGGTPILEVGNPAMLEMVVDMLSQHAARVTVGGVGALGSTPHRGQLQISESTPRPFARTEAEKAQPKRRDNEL